MRLYLIVLIVIASPCYGLSDFKKKFIGSIDHKIPFELTLVNINHELSGNYKYDTEKNWLKLKGVISDIGYFSINEFNGKGSLTGEFYGKLIEDHLVGIWRKPDGSRSYTFLATDASNSSLNTAYNNDSVKIYNLIYEWNEAHNHKAINKFESLYADELLFYTKNMARIDALRKKQNVLNKYEIFIQSIPTPIKIIEYPNSTIKCEFTKKVIHDEKTIDYPSYLLIKNFDGRYLITGESDLITDENRHYKLDIGSPLKSSSILKTILYSLLVLFISWLILVKVKSRINASKSYSSASIVNLFKMRKK